jgi:hypothetical protein
MLNGIKGLSFSLLPPTHYTSHLLPFSKVTRKSAMGWEKERSIKITVIKFHSFSACETLRKIYLRYLEIIKLCRMTEEED